MIIFVALNLRAMASVLEAVLDQRLFVVLVRELKIRDSNAERVEGYRFKRKRIRIVIARL